MTTALELALLAFLPGALIYRGPWLDRDRRAALSAEERVFWAIATSVALAMVAAFALAALERYTFPRLLGSMAGLSVGVGIASRGRLTLGPAASRATWHGAIPLALVLAGLWLYFPTAEYVLGGKDPGTYLNEGVQIAQRGSLLVHDRLVAEVPPETRDLFFPSHQTEAYYGTRFMGFFLLDPDSGDVVGQFPHLFPAVVAIGYGLNGLSGARQAVAFCALLGLLAVYFAGARILGRTTAACGAGLLAINVAFVWFARYPNAELLLLFLTFAGLLAFARAHIDGDAFFAPVAGILIGLTPFARIEAVLLAGSLFLTAVYLVATGRRLSGWFAGTAALLALGAMGYYAWTLTPYVALPLGFVANLRWWHWAGLGLGVTAAGWIALRTSRLGQGADTARLARLGPWVLIAAVVGGAIYAYVFRMPSERLAAHDAAAFRTFAWYVTPLGLAAAVAGFALLVRERFDRAPALFLTVAVFAFFFFYKIRIIPEHFWMARRFLPVLLPAAFLFASGLMWTALLPASRSLLVTRRVVASLLVAWLGWTTWQATAAIRSHVEYAGLIPHLESLASRFGDNDLVLVESRNASDLHTLALPLAYVYARNVLVLNTPRPDPEMFQRFLTWARQRFDNVYFMGGGGTDLLSRSIGVSSEASDRFQIPEFESAYNDYPDEIRYKEYDFGVYRFVDPRGVASWFDLDVGEMDDLHVVRFHAKERHAVGYSYRWTRDVSYVSVLGMTPDARTVTLWLSDGGRPATAPRASVSVSLDEQLLGEVMVDEGLKPYTLAIPPDVAAAAAARDTPARLMLASSVWNPRETLQVPDDRDLGVIVDRVVVR